MEKFTANPRSSVYSTRIIFFITGDSTRRRLIDRLSSHRHPGIEPGPGGLDAYFFERWAKPERRGAHSERSRAHRRGVRPTGASRFASAPVSSRDRRIYTAHPRTPTAAPADFVWFSGFCPNRRARPWASDSPF